MTSRTPHAALFVLFASMILSTAAADTPLGSEWIYQGVLTQNGQPFNGSVPLVFKLYDQATAGNVEATRDVGSWPVQGGKLTVPLDFGPGPFLTGEQRWLQVTVNGIDLAPRQAVSPTPFALYALKAGSIGTISALDAADGNPTNAVFVDNSGNVGVGTTSPAARLNVVGEVRTQGTGNKLVSRNPDNVAALIQLDWYDDPIDPNLNIGRIRWGGSGVGATAGVAFQGPADAERLRITSAGNVGIGTTMPQALLHVHGQARLDGALLCHDSNSVETVRLDPMTGATGGGAVLVRNEAGTTTAELEGSEGVGGGAYLSMSNSQGIVTARLDADESDSSSLELRDAAGITMIELDAFEGDAALLRLSRPDGSTAILLDASDGGGASRITVDVLQINGADLSEQFDVSGAMPIEPGMVVSIDPARPGQLAVSDQPYDARVAGVVSGAGGVRTGVVMRQEGTLADGRHPVALTGRVWCLADADFGAIAPGDRLTTSATPGHAMKAGDAGRASGAVIGKAMTGLPAGKGMILVLVQPQ